MTHPEDNDLLHTAEYIRDLEDYAFALKVAIWCVVWIVLLASAFMLLRFS